MTTEAQKKRKKVMKILAALIVVFLLGGCCSVGGLMFLGGTASEPVPETVAVATETALTTIPGVVTTEANASNATTAAITPTLLPTATPEPTVAPTSLPTQEPAPTQLPELSLSDIQYLSDTTICLENGHIVLALSAMSSALSSEPPDIVAFCAAVPIYKTAVTHDKDCWSNVHSPNNSHLWDNHLFYGLALDKQDAAADLCLDFCTTKDPEYLNLALEKLNEANALVDQSSEALERYRVFEGI